MHVYWIYVMTKQLQRNVEDQVVHQETKSNLVVAVQSVDQKVQSDVQKALSRNDYLVVGKWVKSREVEAKIEDVNHVVLIEKENAVIEVLVTVEAHLGGLEVLLVEEVVLHAKEVEVHAKEVVAHAKEVVALAKEVVAHAKGVEVLEERAEVREEAKVHEEVVVREEDVAIVLAAHPEGFVVNGRKNQKV